MLTEEQQIKIWELTGCEWKELESRNYLGQLITKYHAWVSPKGKELPAIPNLNSLDVLIKIVQDRLDIVTINKNISSDWYVHFRSFRSDYDVDSLSPSLVEALQQALLKLAKQKEKAHA